MRGQRPVDVPHHDGRQAQGDLVEQQQSRVGHQRATDGGGLLLTAREVRADAVAPVGEQREGVEHRGEVPRTGPPAVRAHLQVLLHGERPEDAAPLRDQGDAERDASVVGDLRHVLAVEQHLPRGRVHHPGDRLQQGGLAGAVRTDDGERLALLDVEVETPQRLELTVGGVDAAQLEEGHHAPSSATAPR